MGHAIFKRTQRRLRIFTFLVMTFLLFFSGVFYPLSEILHMPFVGFTNHFNFGDPVLYADYDADNLEHAGYIFLFLSIFCDSSRCPLVRMPG